MRISRIALLIALFAVSTTTTFAEGPSFMKLFRGERSGEHANSALGSTTPREAHAEDTKSGVGERHSSTTPEGMMLRAKGLLGVVSSVGDSTFTVILPANKEHATTTFKVAVSSNTLFMHGSTTASFSDIAVGSRVAVLGKVASSTKTVDAKRVMIAPPVGSEMTTNGAKKGFFEKIKNFFTGKHEKGGERAATSSSAAVVEGSGVIQSVIKSFFSWL